MMAGRNDINTTEGEKVVEQINANTERAASLAEAENAEGLKELAEETETLISSLAGTGSVAVKKQLRDAFTAASQAQPKPAPKAEVVAKPVKEGVIVDKTWDQFEGVKELVTMGAERVAEGIRQQQKVSELSGEIAAVTFDMWLRLPNKEDLPDLKGASDRAKKAAGEMYALAGKGFERTHDNEESLSSLQRGVQRRRTDVRAEWLRSLDEDTEEAAERRALFGKALDKKPKGMSYSQFVAVSLYDSPAMLKGEGEKSAERWKARQEGIEPAPALAVEAVDSATADKWLLADAKKLKADVTKARTAYYEAASPEARAQAQAVLAEVLDSVKKMITETI